MQSKPISVRVLAIVLALVAAYFVVAAVVASAYFAAAISVVGFIGAVSLLASDPRARFLVYIASVIVSASWLVVIVQLAISGWPVAGFGQSLISLIPGILLLALCGGCAMLAARYSSQNE